MTIYTRKIMWQFIFYIEYSIFNPQLTFEERLRLKQRSGFDSNVLKKEEVRKRFNE